MKNESLLVLDRTIPYKIRVSTRAKRLRVAVYLDGDIIVTQPLGTPHDRLKKFVDSKRYWILSKLEQNSTVTNSDLKDEGSEHFHKHHDQALERMNSKVDVWAKRLGFNHGKVSVRQYKSRWGSCSRSGDLSFNYKVIFLIEELQDYVVVHELCHLKQADHSQRFWRLVAKALPEYQDLNKLLKKI